MDEVVFHIIYILICIVAALVTYFITTKLMEKKIISAEDGRAALQKLLDEVINFFDKEVPMAETSLDTIYDYIPANSYQMSTDSFDRIAKTCASDEEVSRIYTTVLDHDTPLCLGEECCIYTIETSGAVYEVQYGVPELIEDKTKSYKYLSQAQLNDIAGIVGKDYEFLMLLEIMDRERKLIREYELEFGNQKIYIKDGEFSV